MIQAMCFDLKQPSQLTSKRKESTNVQWLKMATALDPRFKDLKCLPRSEREAVWKSVKEESAQQPEPHRETEPDQPKKKMNLLLTASDSEEEGDPTSDMTVDRYRSEPSISLEDCPLKWWSEHTAAYPSLAPLAKKYLATPATTVPCERLFSLSGHIVQKKRAALSADNVTRLVCVNNWLKEKKGEETFCYCYYLTQCYIQYYFIAVISSCLFNYVCFCDGAILFFKTHKRVT
ncbi:hypothetical protein ACEWY4_025580 [Coilia grayii]|uniref:HAT C-terminal dimerisation domain-containing protein n=1 Tax=Coilia grayii TaxID=363190 RepID=A0ABD1IV86_9TELE